MADTTLDDDGPEPHTDWGSPAGGFGAPLLDTARRVGHYAWWSGQLFELVGRWSTEVSEPAVTVALAMHSRLFGEHAEWWFARLPELRELPAELLAAAPGDEHLAVVEQIGAVGSDGSIEKLVGVHRVVISRLVGVLGEQLERSTAVADGPLDRTVGMVLRDLHTMWADGERLLATLLIDPVTVRRAADAQALVETALVRAGGILGSAHWASREPEPRSSS